MVVSRLFKEEDLQYLDPVGESDEDYHNEQHEIYEARLRSHSVDEADMQHGFSEYRPKSVIHDADEYYKKHPESIPQNVSWDSKEGGGGDGGSSYLRRRKKMATNESVEVEEDPASHAWIWFKAFAAAMAEATFRVGI